MVLSHMRLAFPIMWMVSRPKSIRTALCALQPAGEFLVAAQPYADATVFKALVLVAVAKTLPSTELPAVRAFHRSLTDNGNTFVAVQRLWQALADAAEAAGGQVCLAQLVPVLGDGAHASAQGLTSKAVQTCLFVRRRGGATNSCNDARDCALHCRCCQRRCSSLHPSLICGATGG